MGDLPKRTMNLGCLLKVWRARIIRPTETAHVFLAATWAGVLATSTNEPYVTYLGAVMPMPAWASLLALLAVCQAVTLLHGDLIPRALTGFTTAIVWTIIGATFIINAPGQTLLGPTMLIVAAGGYLTSGRLIGLHKRWPL